jgi:hypothetical protein
VVALACHVGENGKQCAFVLAAFEHLQVQEAEEQRDKMMAEQPT